MLRAQCALIVVVLMYLAPVQAGNIGTLTIFSAQYLRTLSRAASTDLDAAHYNIAGLAHTDNGFGFNYTHMTWFRLDRLNFDGETYETRKPSPIVPALSMSWKHDSFGLFVNAGIPAGGGASFMEGHPLFKEYEETILDIARTDFGYEFVDRAEPVDPWVIAKSLTIGTSFGGWLQITDMISVAAAIRHVDATLSYEGGATYKLYAEIFGEAPVAEEDVAVDTVHRGSGIGSTFGVHIKPTETLDIGLQFETLTPIELTYNTARDDTGLYPDGTKRRRDLPPKLSLGITYAVSPDLRIGCSANYYFNEMVDFGTKASTNTPVADDFVNGSEISGFVEYQLTPTLVVSSGYLHNRAGHTQEALTSLSWTLNHNIIGGGLTWSTTDWLDLSLGASFAMYAPATNKDETIEYVLWRQSNGITASIKL